MKILKNFEIIFIILIAFTLLFPTAIANAQSKNAIKVEIKKSDPWTIKQVITASELMNQLKNKKAKQPIILQIGFDFLFNQGHIPGSKFIGSASSKSGIELLKNYVKNLKKDSQIVIYCGCCPMNHCPNVQPAFKTLKNLGYKNTKVLYLPDDFDQDWAAKGYPVQK